MSLVVGGVGTRHLEFANNVSAGKVPENEDEPKPADIDRPHSRVQIKC